MARTKRSQKFWSFGARGRAPAVPGSYRATGTIYFLHWTSPLPAGFSSRNSWTPAVSGAKSSRPARNRLLEAPDRSGAHPAGWTAGTLRGRLRGYLAPTDKLRGGVDGDLPGAQRGGKLTDGPVHDIGNVGLQRAGAGNDRTEGGGGCEEGTGSRQALRPSPARLPARRSRQATRRGQIGRAH